MKHAILPREQWTTKEEDVDYLGHLIEQVQKERLEKKEWDGLQ